MAHLQFDHINKIYPNGVQAVFDFNLEIFDHEFIVVVGPSGCGKSTVLRMVAGLEKITSGVLSIDGKRVNEKPPVDRDIAMIFQDYALYGNMTVYENMGFSLTVRKKPTDMIFDRVSEVSKIVGLENELNRLPKNLSGGQRQRVALGRSIVREAKVLLMDEPLSNLDAKLRAQTRRDIILLHHRLRPTILYVTHDQIEAMTMATRIIVMNNGRIQQVGTPMEIYLHPVNVFVAGFIGTPAMNFLKGILKDGYFVKGEIKLELTENQKKIFKNHQDIIIGIRPEHLKFRKPEDASEKNRLLHSRVEYAELLGHTATIRFVTEQEEMTACVPGDYFTPAGSTADFDVEMERVLFFDSQTEEALPGILL